MPNEAHTLIELLAGAGRRDDDAICAPGRTPLSYGSLLDQIHATISALNAFGIGRNDRVAIVLPNGPEMATAFLAVATGATAAPLNPAYRSEEFRFYLEDLRAKALIVEDGSESPALAVAAELGIRMLRLRVGANAPAGSFHLAGEGVVAACHSGPGAAEDTALVLHTSGTTSRPKIVLLSQRNLCAAARNIVASLSLTSADCCLNIMPLFHIHGLIAAVLSSLAAGARLYCTPGFNALKMFTWMADARPSWYTAVPTMHQAILARAERNQALVGGLRLRFIRSSSASLPPQVMAALEETFGCPVIESYGMTEAAHQMSSNPLPPGRRKPGTVGLPAGSEIRIMDAAGTLLGAGEPGEVMIRGANVTAGYENNPAANAEGYRDGWFRTGDQGVMDEDGYLTITGRLKEIINRGGEKISPREVDEALLDHPAVQQCVTFAVPHDQLGEDVAAAVVLREGEALDEGALRDFVRRRLADFKVPRRILFLEEIPKGATGKLQRIGLARKLGLH
ncbi:MAG: AMP-binding protein [Gammaproteobacteria bacterium]|nr:AMP-binding protein [Gammaproteobacteria bacterium]